MPSSVMMADVAGGTRNSSAANLSTAVKGVFSGTESTLNGSFGSDVRVILNVTLGAEAAMAKEVLDAVKLGIIFSPTMWHLSEIP